MFLTFTSGHGKFFLDNQWINQTYRYTDELFEPRGAADGSSSSLLLL
jgi:hypothetical protein